MARPELTAIFGLWAGFIFDCGRVLFGSRVAKREAEGTVHTKHQLNLDPNPEGT